MAVPILRVLVNPGHGLSNATVGKYDPGAVSQYGEEAPIVECIAEDLRDECAKSSPSIVLTPKCDTKCLQSHPRQGSKPSSHLTRVVAWVNQNAKPFDFLLSLHMNAAEREEATGVEVYYANGASKTRREQARVVAEAISRILGIPNRGTFPSAHSQHRTLSILDKTKCPALLIELGFVTNADDVARVRDRGVAALITAIEALREVK